MQSGNFRLLIRFGSLKIPIKIGVQFSFDNCRSMANTILRKEVWGVQKFPMLVTDLNYVFQLVHLVKNVYKERQQFLNIKLPRVPEKGGGGHPQNI